jgi:GT2 family glycosyltransferase
VPRFSLCTVTYNSGTTLASCLDSVLATVGPDDEVFLVDNASRDASPEIVAAYAARDQRLKPLYSRQNLGFAAGTNLGLEQATGEFLVLLNPDTMVTPGWLERMAAGFDRGKVGAVGPTSAGVSGDQRIGLYLPAGYSPTSLADLAATLAAAGREPVETKMLVGFCMMLSRQAVSEVGLLDPDLFLGLDDLDLSWRLRLAGYRLLVATDVYIHHVGRASFDSEPRAVTDGWQRRGADVLARKLERHYGRGRVPTAAELWDLQWFNPSRDIWSPRPTCFVLGDGPHADIGRAAFRAAFEPGDPVRIVEADPDPEPGEWRVWLGPGGDREGELRIPEPTPALLRQAANCLPEPSGHAISIVSVVSCGRDAMHQSLESLLLHSGTGYELVVVEVPGDAACRSYLEDFQANHRPETVLVMPDEPVDFAEGANLGIELATGHVVALVRGDAVVTPGWLGHLVRALDACPGAGAVAPTSNLGNPDAPYASVHALYDHARQRARRLAGRAEEVAALSVDVVVALKDTLAAIRGIPAGPPARRDEVFGERIRQRGQALWLCQDVFIHRYAT